MEHRSEPHSRMEDWLGNLPPSGVRAVCSWERFCTFAREPERRKVGGDVRASVDGVNYEVDPDLTGETVILWWGIFDNELYVEHGISAADVLGSLQLGSEEILPNYKDSFEESKEVR